ncbi:TatD family hydrolase [Catenovulum sp. SM1970]|uniref:TatD family hydrolase n=1 Tax=Marinifaba aquimaris TaxID=2741323 RepID=UPI001572C5E8|nr:TatD family hydrolase [Marinifaba aquimaris]
MNKLVDIGVNLTNSRFDKDRQAVIEQCKVSGVEKVIVTGTDLTESVAAQALAAQYPHQLYSTAGVHPHDAKSIDVVDDMLAQLTDLYRREEVVAIGECGLDFNRDFSPRPQQQAIFKAQVELACQLNAPLFMHQRDAHDTFIEIVKPFREQIRAGVVHCFTGTETELNDYLELGFYIGFTGWVCDERRGQDVLALTRLVPQDRLLIETDAPYLLPRSLRPKPKSSRNLPQFLPHILETIANQRNESIDELAEATWHNSHRLFGLV